MRRYLLLFLVVVTLGVSLPAWSATLDEARNLHEAGKTQEALATIEGVLGSDAADAEKAEALDLLGTIAVEAGQLPMAKQAWSRLVEDYPEYAAGHDTATKLSLVSALVKTVPTPEVPAKVVDAPPAQPVAEPAPAAVAPAPATPARESSKPEAAAPSAPAATQADSTGIVLVAARGKPHDAVRLLSDRIVEHLRDKGVNAQSATGGIPVVEDSQMVLPLLLQKGASDNAESMVLLTADFVSMQKVALDCYATSGAKIWKVKVSGGTGWKGRPYSKTGINEELAERFLEKLDEKIGGPGLPVMLK